jgi:hypothetical protein
MVRHIKIKIIGPYFLEEDGHAATMTSARYLTIYDSGFFHVSSALKDVWFEQDGATPHTARLSINFLRENFPGRLISLREYLNWPARSPNLAPAIFFCGGT